MKHKTASAVRVRHGREGDVDAFVRIWQAIWRDGFAEMLAIDVGDSRFVMGMAHAALIPIARDIIVATLSGRVVGFVYRNLAMIDDLWVDPQVQGRGVGRLLLRRALATIAARRLPHRQPGLPRGQHPGPAVLRAAGLAAGLSVRAVVVVADPRPAAGPLRVRPVATRQSRRAGASPGGAGVTN